MSDIETHPLWRPSPERIAAANLTRFLAATGHADYDSLYRWSIDQPAAFWDAVATFCGLELDAEPVSILEDAHRMPGARWFSGARLNFARNLLRFDDDREALVFWNENGPRRSLTYAELRRQVARFAAGLADAGVEPGDRIAGFVPSCPEAVVAMLAATSLGAVWSSCSPDFGYDGALDRFGQIQPKVLITADGYLYAGKEFDSLDKVRRLAAAVDSIERVVVIPYRSPTPDLDGLPLPALFGDFGRDDRELSLRLAALRPSRLHPVFLGDDGQAQVHRPRRRRHAVAAPQGAGLAHRPPARRSPVLLHHLRLDDVELAGLWLGDRGDTGSLRRLAVPPDAGSSLADGRARAHHGFRNQRQIPGRLRKARPRPKNNPRPVERPHDPVHRLAAGAGEL
jgi:hypothetical protein